MNGREKYIASQTPRVRRKHPARSAQALNTSGAGIVHRQMMDLQRQPNLNKADTAKLKDLRRDWNRNRKYTDAGMKISGASSPLDAQKYFVDTTRDFRDTNRDAYASMYPLTNMAMEYPQKGGILGMIAKEIFGKVSDFGKSIINKEGIAGAADTNEEEMKDYAAQTFGAAYPYNIHEDEFTDTENWYDDRKDVVIPPLDNDYGDFTSLHPFDDSRREAAIMSQYPGKAVVSPSLGSPNIHEDEPWPYQDTEVIEETTQDGNLISDELWDSIRDFDPSTLGKPGNIHAGEDIIVPPWLLDPNLPMPPELLEGEYPPGKYHDELIEGPPPIPRFDDSVRERAIMERYPESFIGPPIDPSWRPDMYDVTGPRLIDRGLFPYPNYNEEITLAPPPFYGGRGEMPGMDSPDYYNDMMEGIERGVREKELQDAREADQGRSLITIPPDFDPDRKEFTDTEDYYEWIRDMRKYEYR